MHVEIPAGATVRIQLGDRTRRLRSQPFAADPVPESKRRSNVLRSQHCLFGARGCSEPACCVKVSRRPEHAIAWTGLQPTAEKIAATRHPHRSQLIPSASNLDPTPHGRAGERIRALRRGGLSPGSAPRRVAQRCPQEPSVRARAGRGCVGDVGRTRVGGPRRAGVALIRRLGADAPRRAAAAPAQISAAEGLQPSGSDRPAALAHAADQLPAPHGCRDHLSRPRAGHRQRTVDRQRGCAAACLGAGHDGRGQDGRASESGGERPDPRQRLHLRGWQGGQFALCAGLRSRPPVRARRRRADPEPARSGQRAHEHPQSVPHRLGRYDPGAARHAHR